MFGRPRPSEPDPALEGRLRELVSPLAGAEPATPAARSALRQALGGGSLPRSPRLHAWQRAAVSLAGVFVPLFAIGSVAGLGGTSAVTAPLDAVAGVFKANGPRAGEPVPAVLAKEEGDPAAEGEALACEDASTAARAELEALLDSGVLNSSAAAGVGAALAVLADCGQGAAQCQEATATAQEILQALLDSETLPDEGRAGIEKALEAIESCGTGAGDEDADDNDEAEAGEGETGDDGTDEGAIASEHGGGPGSGHETCFAATEHAREIIQALLDDEDRPEQSKKGLERALEAIENCGTGNGKAEDEDRGDGDAAGEATAAEPTAGTAVAGAEAAATPAPGPARKPEKPGKPETAGAATSQKPVDAGPPPGHGKPDTAGQPPEAGNPHGDGSGAPGDTNDHGQGPGAAGANGNANGAPPADHPGNGGGQTNGGNGNGHGNGSGPQSKPGRP